MAKKHNSKYKVGDKFEDVDIGKIVWRYQIEAVSKQLDLVRGIQPAYFVIIHYEELNGFDKVYTQTTYTMMSERELSNERFIKYVTEWTDNPFGFEDKTKEDKHVIINKMLDKNFFVND